MVKHLFPVLFLPFPIGNCSFGTLTSIKLQSLILDKLIRSKLISSNLMKDLSIKTSSIETEMPKYLKNF